MKLTHLYKQSNHDLLSNLRLFKFQSLILLAAAITSCSDEPEGFGSEFQVEEESVIQWWLLVTENSEGEGTPGIYLYDEDEDTVLIRLNIPDGLSSPQALDYDGSSLWVVGEGENSPIYEINPADSTIVSTIPDISSSGLAIDQLDSSRVWISRSGEIVQINKNGTTMESFQISSTGNREVAVFKERLFYLEEGESDAIVEVDRETGIETLILNTKQQTIHAFTISGSFFTIVADDNAIRQYDIFRGLITKVKPLRIKGTVKAIAPDRIVID